MTHSPLAAPSATIDVLKRWGLHTKKSLGQHFLVDDNVVGKILALAEVGEDDCILEVGPGIGTLTAGLLARNASVIAIERDPDLPPVLRENVADVLWDDARRFSLIEADALDVDEGVLTDAAARLERPELPRKFVANLPYAVAATIVLDYLQRFAFIETMCIMVQSEVAARMCAEPGSKDYGAYSVKIALLAEAAGSFAVGPQSFLPPPRVDSTVIRLDRRMRETDADGNDAAILEDACLMADAAFYQRRKTIRNSIGSFLASKGHPKGLVDELLATASIDPRSRGESHPPEAYLALGKAYHAMRNLPPSPISH